jgi:PAS domain S-box-containing protein
MRAGFAGLLLLVAGAFSALFWSFDQIEQAAQARRQANGVVAAANDFLSALKDAETGQRGYLLTNDDAFLQPYLAVRDNIQARLSALNQLAAGGAGQIYLTPMTPLVQAYMLELSSAIEMHRSQNQTAAQALVSRVEGKHAMDAIRLQVHRFVQSQVDVTALRDAEFVSDMRRLFTVIVFVSLLALLAVVLFAWWLYRETRQRLKNLVHLETQHLLHDQEQINQMLRVSEEKLAVTLDSIGDAVIATDAEACVTLLNPVAQELTGWTQEEAFGRPIDDVFQIINKDSRQAATIPVALTLSHGKVQGLANHTVLVSRDAREFDIADSCAPIRDAAGTVVGAVLVFRNVTEEYAVQQSLRDSAALVQTILNTVVDGIVTIHAHGGIIESVNPAIEAMFGYAGTDLVGQPLSLIIAELDQDQHTVSLDYYGVSEEARAMGVGREVMGRRKDGSAFPLEIAVSEMTLRGQRYFTGILRDITARKETQTALQKAGALQSAIFNSANFSSIATDAQGVIQIFNVGAERMLGYSAVEVMNKITPADISDPQEVIARAIGLSAELDTPITPGFEALVFKASRGIEDIYELTYIRKDGSRFPAVVSVTALRDKDDAIIGYLLIGTDNTMRKQIEAERTRLEQVLQNKNLELESARQVADTANLAKSEFLSSMSHELRSPLNAILGFAQLLQSGEPEPTTTQMASVDQILKAGWYLLELINEILDLALIESGRLSLSLEPTSLHEVLQDCQSMIEPQAQQRGINLTFATVQADCFVSADRTRLKQVVINLLSNAIKYNKPGGSAEVTYAPRASGRLRISVTDSGNGLSPQKLAQLFQSFNRLGQEGGAEEGTGIGLVVSRRLVELMRGEIGATSTVGVGSVFWFELDTASAPQWLQDGHLPPALPDQSDLPESHLRTLLYVEDNKANMELVVQLIARRPDWRLLGAQDAIRGIAMARAHQPDVILMDINLPGISGMQALQILREDASTRHIPVLALSANAMPRDIERGLVAGFFRYLTKPIRVSEFMEALDEGLSTTPATGLLSGKKKQH